MFTLRTQSEILTSRLHGLWDCTRKAVFAVDAHRVIGGHGSILGLSLSLISRAASSKFCCELSHNPQIDVNDTNSPRDFSVKPLEDQVFNLTSPAILVAMLVSTLFCPAMDTRCRRLSLLLPQAWTGIHGRIRGILFESLVSRNCIQRNFSICSVGTLPGRESLYRSGNVYTRDARASYFSWM